MEIILCIVCALCVLICCSQFFHQWKMKRNAYIMREALRNKDFSFRLSTKGMWSGERAMMEVLNNMGQEMSRLISENEVESWQKLTRVLTHEIMNATTPIISISQALLQRKDVKETPLEDGIKAIHDTGKSLGHFVESYRKFTQLQKPQPESVNLSEFAEGISSLYADIRWHFNIAGDITVSIDTGLVRQVMINLTKNAIEAGAKNIELVSKIESGDKVSLFVSNDGAPIPYEVGRDIFTPFYTTKSTGSGIGLSLSRQIMVMMGGSLGLLDRARANYNVTFQILLCMSGVSAHREV